MLYIVCMYICACLCVVISLSTLSLSSLALSFTNSRKRKEVDTSSVKSDKSSIPMKSDKSSTSSPQADVKVNSHVTLQGITNNEHTHLNGKLAFVTEITNGTSGAKYTVLVIDENKTYTVHRRMLKLVTQSKYEEMETQAKAFNRSSATSNSSRQSTEAQTTLAVGGESCDYVCAVFV